MAVRGKDYSATNPTINKLLMSERATTMFIIKNFKKLNGKKIECVYHAPRIKEDKLGRICAIHWSDAETDVTPPEFKEALNMFRGRQLKKNLRQCLEYIRLVRLKDAGDIAAKEELNNLHYSWNNPSCE